MTTIKAANAVFRSCIFWYAVAVQYDLIFIDIYLYD